MAWSRIKCLPTLCLLLLSIPFFFTTAFFLGPSVGGTQRLSRGLFGPLWAGGSSSTTSSRAGVGPAPPLLLDAASTQLNGFTTTANDAEGQASVLHPGSATVWAPSSPPSSSAETPDRHQAAAILTSARYVLLVSGAGTGKTRVLAARMAHLVASKQVKPSEVLILSFSKAAAKSIQARASALLSSSQRRGGESSYEDGGGDNHHHQQLPVVAGTFHALAASLLRTHSHLIQGHGFSGRGGGRLAILSKSEQVEVMREVIVREEGHDSCTVSEAQAMLRHISVWKAEGANPGDIDPSLCITREERRAWELHGPYQSLLASRGLLDMDDLLITALQLFRRHPHVLEGVRSRYKHILVDEFQDTNHAQYQLLKALALGITSPHDYHEEEEAGPSVFCAGDDDQSIYSFQGARAGRAFSAFLEDFPGAVALGLRTSYRLPGHLFAAAKTVIEQNEPDRFIKLEEEEPVGPKGVRLDQMARATLSRIAVQEAWDDRDEANWIAKKVAEHAQVVAAGGQGKEEKKKARPLSQVAVLARSSWQLRVIQDAFKQRHIPYRLGGRAATSSAAASSINSSNGRRGVVAGAKGVSKREEEELVARAMAVLRLVEEGGGAGSSSSRGGSRTCDWDEELVVAGAAGASSEVMKEIRALARERQCGYLEAAALVLRHRGGGEEGGEAVLLRGLVEGHQQWGSVVQEGWASGRPVEALLQVMEEAGVALVPGVVALCERVARENGGAVTTTSSSSSSWWPVMDMFKGKQQQQVAVEEEEEEEEDAVVLATMHEAKGQEYDMVFLPGWDEGVFPLRPKQHQPQQAPGSGGATYGDVSSQQQRQSLMTSLMLKEERRLAYVALTRARVNAFITFSHRRQMGAKQVSCSPSRFLKELPPQLVRFSFLGAKKALYGIKPTNDADFRKLKPWFVKTRHDEPITMAAPLPMAAVVGPPQPQEQHQPAAATTTTTTTSSSAAAAAVTPTPSSKEGPKAAVAEGWGRWVTMPGTTTTAPPPPPLAPVSEGEEEEVPAAPTMEEEKGAAAAAVVSAPVVDNNNNNNNNKGSKVARGRAATAVVGSSSQKVKAAATTTKTTTVTTKSSKAAKVQSGGGGDGGGGVMGKLSSMLDDVEVAKQDLRPFYLTLVKYILHYVAPPSAPTAASSSSKGTTTTTTTTKGSSTKKVAALSIPVAARAAQVVEAEGGAGVVVVMRRVTDCTAEELGLFAVDHMVASASSSSPSSSKKEGGGGAWEGAKGVVKGMLRKIMGLYGLKTTTSSKVDEMGSAIKDALLGHQAFKRKEEEGGAE